MVSQRISFWSVDWMQYPQDRVKGREFVKDVTNFRVPQKYDIS
jgi:hypothetical protein